MIKSTQLLLVIFTLALTGCAPRVERVEVPYVVDRTVVEVVKVPEPYVVEKVVIEVVTVNQTIEKEIIKEVIKYRDRTDWRYFESLTEFTAWVDDKLVVLFPINGDTKTADCDDYAERLQREAYKDGYFISVQIVETGRIMGKVVSDNEGLHMGNLVMIGNGVYYVEPQPEKFRIIRICDRD